MSQRDIDPARGGHPELWISLASLAIAIATPFVGYLWLQDKQRETTIKAKALQASGTVSTVLDTDPKVPPSSIYIVTIRNGGSLPIENVVIAVRNDNPKDAPPDLQKITSLPPVRFDLESHGDDLAIVLKDPLAPNQELDLDIAQIPQLPNRSEPSVWVSSEATPSIPVVWRELPGAGW